jgi:MFS family permease
MSRAPPQSGPAADRLAGAGRIHADLPVYALLFDENGLSTAEISSLFVLWSVVTFLLEVPSGAWADTVSRQLLLCLSSVAYGAAFSSWLLFPTAAGFAAGFALWGLSSALSSGTFQALAYDELAAMGARNEYARVIGVGTSLALVAMAAATLLAAPLVALGGYALTGWVSVAVCAVQFLVARALPSTASVISAADAEAAEERSEAHLAASGAPTTAAQDPFLRRYVWSSRYCSSLSPPVRRSADCSPAGRPGGATPGSAGSPPAPASAWQ